LTAFSGVVWEAHPVTHLNVRFGGSASAGSRNVEEVPLTWLSQNRTVEADMSDRGTPAPTLRFHATIPERTARLLNRLALDRKLAAGGRINASGLLVDLIEAEAQRSFLANDAQGPSEAA
jgi:hypothetical protein